ncbi:cytochrome P450, partial [Thamnocephalis sphaerospora]
IYNLFLSPLRSVPGPLLAKLTTAYDTYLRLCGQSPFIRRRLHEQYGPVVRLGECAMARRDIVACKQLMRAAISTTGPNQLSVGTADALRVVLHDEGFRKSEAFFLRVRHTNPFRLVGPSFAPRELIKHESLIWRVGAGELMEKLEIYASSGDVIDIHGQFRFLATDVISALLYGRCFHMLRVGEQEPLFRLLRLNLVYRMIVRTRADWYAKRALLTGPTEIGHAHFLQRHIDAARDTAAAAAATGQKVILHQLIEARDPDTDIGLTDEEITAEMVVISVAAIDTTQDIMTWTIDFMLHHPECRKQLVAELDAAYPDRNTEIRYQDRHQFPYLEACVLEAFRMKSPTPNGMLRNTPAGGRRVCGVHVPAGTMVDPDGYSSHYDAQLWKDPDMYRPERFLGAGAVEARKQLFHFGAGPRTCAGQTLAMMEVVHTLAALFRRFDVVLAGERPRPIHQIFLNPHHNELGVRVTVRA